MGATITGAQADLDLGIKTFLNGALVSNIVVDTSTAPTDTIDYVVTDQNGLTSTSTRTVIIQVPQAAAVSSDDASSSVATSTPQWPRVQMGSADPRIRELFNHVRRAIDLLEELTLRPPVAPEQPKRREAEKAAADRPQLANPQKFAYSIKEVREMVGISHSSIYAAIGSRDLRAVKHGHRTLILAADLQDWIARWPSAR